MKKLNCLCLLLILLVDVVFSQTIDKYIPLTPTSKITIEQKDGTDYFYSGPWRIGKRTIENSNYVARSYYVFNLSAIPDNATITRVEVNYSMDGSSYTFKLTKLTSLSGDLQARWNAVGNATSLHTGLTYGNSDFISTPIKNEIAGALISDQLIIGALSEAEGTSGSNSTLDFVLHVYYTIPAQSVNITVRNDLWVRWRERGRRDFSPVSCLQIQST
ncbi:MAG TPA: hypothetical protein ENN90_10550 [Mariniphaga anaerophila]|uniref:DNRLRE domain-containing protein n=1 Tax=Mariniphaga anaerophila TaxID=1484053 RepID=A0A831LSI0_9BACT|nr:hypothetical protein [Mariniphaga anaerophila]